MAEKPKAALLIGPFGLETVYPGYLKDEIRDMCDLVLDAEVPDDLATLAEPLAEVEILFSTWGCPLLNEATLKLMPKLRAVFYAAGSLRQVVTPAFWERNIPISSSWAVNARPVAEFTFAQIILSLKCAFAAARETRRRRAPSLPEKHGRTGAYDARVGLVSLGQIGQQVAERLQALDVEVVAFDPFVDESILRSLNIRRVDLTEVFASCDVVSLHAPWLPETEGMITGELLRSMPQGATFINTARGALVDQDALIDVFRERTDLQALLDVVYPEPLPADSPLYDLPNVFMTPHVAGSLDREHARMGRSQVNECRRFLNGEPLKWSVTKEAAARMA